MPRQFFVGGNFKMYVPLLSDPQCPAMPLQMSLVRYIRYAPRRNPTTNLLRTRNGSTESIKGIINNLNSAQLDPSSEVVVSPPALYLPLTRELANDKIGVAAQNVFDKPNGAFTGEISVEQLQDTNINWTLVGHSERRVILKESDEFIARKVKSAVDGGLGVIFCIGETLEVCFVPAVLD
jgi:hypothetical protein